MGKTFAAMAAAILLTLGAAFAFGFGLYQSRDDVSMAVEYQKGDPSAAEGLELCAKVLHEGKQSWELCWNAAAPSESSTEYAVSSARHWDDLDHPLLRPSAYSLDLFINTWLPQEYLDKTEYFGAPGEEAEVTIPLSDLFDYYPLSLYLNTPVCAVLLDAPFHDEFPYSENIAALTEKFKIPVQPNASIGGHLVKNGDNLSFSHTYSNHAISLYSPSVYSHSLEGMFFGLSVQSADDPQPVDTSHIEPGWGLYFLPCYDIETEEVPFRAEELRLVYPLDPAAQTLLDVSLSPDEENILLHVLEDRDYVLYVLDARSGRQSGCIRFEGNSDHYQISYARNALLVSGSNSAQAVLIEYTDGGCRLAIEFSELPYVMNEQYEFDLHDMLWDGQKLVLLYTSSQFDTAKKLGLQICSKEALTYEAVYSCSLYSQAEPAPSRLLFTNYSAAWK